MVQQETKVEGHVMKRRGFLKAMVAAVISWYDADLLERSERLIPDFPVGARKITIQTWNAGGEFFSVEEVQGESRA